jgi:hypothetical protein
MRRSALKENRGLQAVHGPVGVPASGAPCVGADLRQQAAGGLPRHPNADGGHGARGMPVDGGACWPSDARFRSAVITEQVFGLPRPRDRIAYSPRPDPPGRVRRTGHRDCRRGSARGKSSGEPSRLRTNLQPAGNGIAGQRHYRPGGVRPPVSQHPGWRSSAFSGQRSSIPLVHRLGDADETPVAIKVGRNVMRDLPGTFVSAGVLPRRRPALPVLAPCFWLEAL